MLENPIECEDRGLHASGERRKIAYCGRLTEEKGADLAAEVARFAGLPGLFAGDGPLRSRIEEIDPDAGITGWLDKAEARRRIAAEALVVVTPEAQAIAETISKSQADGDTAYRRFGLGADQRGGGSECGSGLCEQALQEWLGSPVQPPVSPDVFAQSD